MSIGPISVIARDAEVSVAGELVCDHRFGQIRLG